LVLSFFYYITINFIIFSFYFHTKDIKLVNETFKKQIKSLPLKFEYDFESSDINSGNLKIPTKNSNVKLEIVLINWQKEFYVSILDSGGQPFIDENSNNLVIRPQKHLLNAAFSFTKWQIMMKKSIDNFLTRFYHRCFDKYKTNHYDFDKLKEVSIRDSKKRICLHSSKTSKSIHVMCRINDAKFLNNLINRFRIKSSNMIPDKITNSTNDSLENLIDELEDMNRDKNNPLFFLNQLIIDNYHKRTKSSRDNSISTEKEMPPVKMHKAYDSDWDSS
jgi:hypothetical protein